LVLRKIIKIVAIRCHILKLKCTKFDIAWNFRTGFKGKGEGREWDIRGEEGMV